MTRTSALLFSALLVSLTLGAVPADPTEKPVACFDHSGKDTQGNDEILSKVQYVLTEVDGDPVAPLRELTLDWGTPQPVCPDDEPAVRSDDLTALYDNLQKVFEIARTKDVNTREAAARLAEMRIEAARV